MASDSGASGDVAYGLVLTVTGKVLLPDWGTHAGLDTPSMGRPVDLKTPDPHALVENVPGGTLRDLAMPCAWQSEPNQVHYYRVSLPSSGVANPLKGGRGSLDTLIYARADAPDVTARVYDTEGVLVAESRPRPHLSGRAATGHRAGKGKRT